MDWHDVQGYFEEYHRREYDRLVNLIPDNSLMVEVGCFRGRSLASISSTIKKKNLLVWAVDVFDEANYHEPDVMRKRTGMYADFTLTMAGFGLTPVVTRGNSLKAVSEYPDRVPSLVFVDADHSYEGVMKDIDAWLPRLLPGGILCGHDYGPEWPGVVRAVNERFTKFDVNSEIWSLRK